MKPRHPARRKIHHPYNQLVNQILAAIQDRQLRARLFNTNLWAEINAQLIRWFARLWKWLSRNNAPNAHLYPLKVLKGHDWQRHQPTSSLFSRFTCFLFYPLASICFALSHLLTQQLPDASREYAKRYLRP